MKSMNIYFFEIEEWEQQYLTKNLKGSLLHFFDETLDEDCQVNYKNAEIISVFVYSKITKKIIDKCPNLKMIITRSTGFDHIDIDYAKSKKIKVCNIPHYGENTVAEHAFTLILALSRKLIPSIELTKKGEFLADKNLRGFDLAGKTLGIIGTGRIGSRLAEMAHCFGLNLLGFDKIKNHDLEQKYGLRYVPLKKLLSSSDIVSLNCRHTEKTHHLINKETLNSFKKGSYLINTARGGLIDSMALIEALEDGTIAGAGLDVLEEECSIKEDTQILSKQFPKKCLMVNIANNLLMRRDNVIITPHNAFNSVEAFERILETTCETISALQKGEVLNEVVE